MKRQRKSRKELLIEDMRKRFIALRADVRDFEPDSFDRLEQDFFDMLAVDYRSFKKFCIDWQIKRGKCPAREWLKNRYPITKTEVMFLRASRLLTEESRNKFFTLLRQYFFKYENSGLFRERCKRQNDYGFNSLGIWLDEHNFRPAYKSAEGSADHQGS